MKTIRHGLLVGIERLGDELIFSMTVSGKLKHSDYEIMVPMLESALDGISEPKIKALTDLREFEGWELKAAWDDFKFGLKHGREFSKIAVVGNKKWEELMSKVASWFVSGEVQYFEDLESAENWLAA